MKKALIRDSLSGQVTGAKAISNNALVVRLCAAFIKNHQYHACIWAIRDYNYNKWKYYIWNGVNHDEMDEGVLS